MTLSRAVRGCVLGVLNDRDPDRHIIHAQSDRLASKNVMGVWIQFVYESVSTFLRYVFVCCSSSLG